MGSTSGRITRREFVAASAAGVVAGSLSRATWAAGFGDGPAHHAGQAVAHQGSHDRTAFPAGTVGQEVAHGREADGQRPHVIIWHRHFRDLMALRDVPQNDQPVLAVEERQQFRIW